MTTTEDWWAVWLGLIMFFLGLMSVFDGADLVGWMAKTKTWVWGDFGLGNMIKPAGKGWMSRGLQLGGGFSFILALAVGLIIGNIFKGFAAFLKEAAKPEWFIKTAIVYLGIKIGLMSMKAAGFTFELAIAGMCATIVAYMLFWPITYWLGRKPFNLSRAASAALASGVSICGVSAAIATAGAIRAKAVLPVMVSMLIVVFAMFELIILPAFYTYVAPDAPVVNGTAMGMTVKTDGADAAAGAILDELMLANAEKRGIHWEEGWILTANIMAKIWIDMFIGLWAFLLALIWVYHAERKPGQSHVPASPNSLWAISSAGSSTWGSRCFYRT